MDNNKEFKKLLNNLPDSEYVGLGNPGAQILFIGKEAGTEIGTEIYHGSVKSWKDMTFNYAERFKPEEAKLRNL